MRTNGIIQMYNSSPLNLSCVRSINIPFDTADRLTHMRATISMFKYKILRNVVGDLGCRLNIGSYRELPTIYDQFWTPRPDPG